MTDKEALKEFKKFVSTKTTMPPAFVDNVEKALRKQIPMKPGYEFPEVEEGYCHNTCAGCPNCDEDLDIEVQFDYCPSCGQKIDWSDFIEQID